jgi:DNA invertase Pin-like site-specific DNA recombinase
MLGMLSAVACKDYKNQRCKQSDAICKARMAGQYKERSSNSKLYKNIMVLFDANISCGNIVNILGCSRATISKVGKSTHNP